VSATQPELPAASAPGLPDRRVLIPAIGVTQILSWGSSFYLLGPLAAPIAADTGWDIDWVVGGVSIGLLTAGAVSPLVGRTIGERGGGLVLALGATLLGSGLFCLGVAQHFVIYFAGWLLLGAGMGAGLYDAAFATIGSIYGREARSVITAVTLFGGFASTVCWPLSTFLLERWGWRASCFAFAAIQFGFSLPIYLALLPRRSFVARAAEDGTVKAPALAPSERPLFVLVAAVLTIAASILAMVGTHLLVLLQARGFDLAAAVGFGMVIGPAQVGGRVCEALARGRHHPIWTMIISAVLVAIGTGMLFAGVVAVPMVAAAIVFYGAGNGISSIARGTLPLALFGPERYAAIAGRLAAPMLISMAVAPYLGALALKAGGPNGALALLFGLAALNLFLVATLWRLCRGRDPA
jgi:predicted MFS family arabinose efflux permease